MRKPISVQFKFFKDLQFLTDPTEPRMPTVKIPAQKQRKLSKLVKRHQIPEFVTLFTLVVAIALCGCLFLAIVYPHF
jgi:hypothetical protein